MSRLTELVMGAVVVARRDFLVMVAVIMLSARKVAKLWRWSRLTDAQQGAAIVVVTFLVMVAIVILSVGL